MITPPIYNQQHTDHSFGPQVTTCLRLCSCTAIWVPACGAIAMAGGERSQKLVLESHTELFRRYQRSGLPQLDQTMVLELHAAHTRIQGKILPSLDFTTRTGGQGMQPHVNNRAHSSLAGRIGEFSGIIACDNNAITWCLDHNCNVSNYK